MFVTTPDVPVSLERFPKGGLLRGTGRSGGLHFLMMPMLCSISRRSPTLDCLRVVQCRWGWCLAAAFGVVSAAMPVRATQIVWDVSIGSPHALSDGRLFPDTVIFSLGVFASGFTPTSVNVGQWAANWTPASHARWDSQVRYYSGVVDFTQNVIPFVPGAPAYVWAVSGREWMLFRRSTWTWPLGSSIGGPPIVWSADQGVTAVVGAVRTSGQSYFYQTAAVTAGDPEAISWVDWRSLHFTAAQLGNVAVSGPTADPDGDGVNNTMEYAWMTWPMRGASRVVAAATAGLVRTGAGEHLSIEFSSDPRARLGFTAEASGGLGSWASGPEEAVVFSSVPGLAVYRSVPPVDGGRRFLRLRVVPQ